MRFLIRLIVIVLVAVGIAVAGLLMLPGEKIARIAADQLSKQTGRAVTISSDTSISLYPTLGVTTGPASIASADWAKNGPLMTTDSLAIGIDVPALIGGTIRITKLEAKSPRIVLERAADGRANWELLPSGDTTVEPTTPIENSADGQSFDLSLERALVTDAGLRYIDHGTGTDQNFKDVDIDLRWPSLGGPAQLALGITPFADRLNLDTTVADVMSLIAGEQTTLMGTLTAAGADLSFEGIASIKPEAAMQLTGTIPDVGALMRALGQDPATFGMATTFNPSASIDSQVSFDGTRLALRKMALGLNDSTVSGDADIVLALGAPQVTAKLNADIKNAGALMRQFGQAPENFGLDSAFDPSFSSAITLSTRGSDITAKLTGLNAILENAKISGDTDISLRQSVPDVTAILSVNLPNAARTATLLGQPLSKFGFSADADPAVKTNVSARLQGSDVTAKLTDLSASLESAQVSGQADIAIIQSVPDITAALAVNLPNAARTAALVGQPLSNLGLSSNATPAVKTNVSARIKGSNINANLRDVVASIGGASISGAMDIALAGGAPALSGNIKAAIPSTANFMSALAQAAPDLPKGFGRTINASTKIAFKSNQLDLTGLTVSLDQNTLSGGVSIGLGGSVPSVNATLRADNLDFSALAPADSGASESSSAGTGWPKDRIDASALGLLNGNIKLTANSINLGIMQLSAVDVGVVIDRARAVVSINGLRAFQGGFAGQLIANNRNGLSVAGDLRATSVALGPMLNTLADIDKIAGNGNLNIQFLGSGNSVDSIMRSLNGQIGMSVPQGTIAGIDLEGLIRQGNANASLTQFENLKANGAINDGKLQNNDLTVSTGRVDAKGEGYINLGAQTIDYLATPIAKDVGSQDRIEIPVRIKGPWSDVKIRPDLEAALNLENERKKLEEQARKEIEREKQKLRDQAEAEKEKLRKLAEAEAKKLEDKARKKVDEAAKKAAAKAAKQLGLDKAAQKKLQDAAKNSLEKEIGNGLKNLLGGN